MTKSELKDIIKECLLEMNCNITDNELAVAEGCSFSDINDEISLFEANVSYILSANEACILQESVGDTVKAILDKVVKAIKLVIKKIGEFISFIIKKIKGLKNKFSIKTKQLIARAKEIKAKKGKINEEKLESKKHNIEENYEVLQKAIEDFRKYLNDKGINSVDPKCKNISSEYLYDFYLSYNSKEAHECIDKFHNYATDELSKMKKILDLDDNEIDDYDIDERVKSINLNDVVGNNIKNFSIDIERYDFDTIKNVKLLID